MSELKLRPPKILRIRYRALKDIASAVAFFRHPERRDESVLSRLPLLFVVIPSERSDEGSLFCRWFIAVILSVAKDPSS